MFLKKIFIFILIAVIGLILPSDILASEGRNIFGLHLTQPADIDSAKTIINSRGGDWGWATVVIRSDQLDHNTWQDFFDACRENHIIPIVRLATIVEHGYWRRPSTTEIDSMVEFLNSLNWPTKRQHVILFNEINHASEWGGGIDISNFADTAIYAAKKLKKLNPDFYILSSGLDLAAPDKSPNYMSAPTVYRQLFDHKREYFDVIDAISSHSYPNHGFIGTPDDSGWHSIRGYENELSFLKDLGINRDYPVFITETGWPHKEGTQIANNYYDCDTAASYYKKALEIWQQDDRIQAVTPFIYNYASDPFDHFSWLDPQGKLYSSYQQIINMPKSQNSPDQLTRYTLVDIRLPIIIFTNSQANGTITIKNTGQSIWGENNFCLIPHSTTNVELDSICTNKRVLPGHSITIPFNFKIKTDTAHAGKTYLGWGGLPPFEVVAVSDTSHIYHPKVNLAYIVRSAFDNFFRPN